MSLLNLSDRLKAAVNSIDAAGTSLQQRALGQNQHQAGTATSGSAQAQSASSRPQSPSIAKAASAASPIASPTIETGPPLHAKDKDHATTATSPTKYTSQHSYAAANALAEGALTGLRKSFNFGRQSLEGARPGPSSPKSVTTTVTSPTAQPAAQELKDIQASPTVGTSRPGSPGRFLAANFSVGSDSPSIVGTPRARSPRPKSPQPGGTHKSPLATHPPPNPSDPATYPLPPSPTIPPSPLPLSPALYADPLGASPLLPPMGDDAHGVPPELPGPPAVAVEGSTLGDEEPADLQEPADIASDVTEGTSGGAAKKSLDGTGPSEEVRKSGESARAVNGQEVTAVKLAKAERRYEDLSNRFTTLLTQKHNADKILKELTPLEGGIGDSEALEGWVRMMNGKVEMITEEMKRLQGKINLQESRIEELRDTHRLEGSSQSELISKLRSQLSTAESSLATKSSETASLAKLKEDLGKAQTTAKEEEEKRTKAISLLKTVRMKLVKVEKEKEENERDRAEERAERSSAKDEVERVKAEKEREVNSLRKGFERETAGVKERAERDLAAKKAAWELEMITTKAAHAKEISGKSTKVQGLEAIVKELSQTNASQFEDLQAKTAEVESGRNELETLRGRTKELEFQLREALERCAILEDSSARPSARRDHLSVSRAASPSPSRGSAASPSPMEVQRLLADAEAKSEAKISDLRNKILSLEGERNDAEEEWAAKLSERVRELEKLRRVIAEKETESAESLRTRRDKERLIEEAEGARKEVEREMKALGAEVEEARTSVTLAVEAERAAREELGGLQAQITNLQGQLDDAKAHSTNLRNNNKTLREELRKVQSSVQLLEKSRNPGVGYWSSNNASSRGPGVLSPEPVQPSTPATPSGSRKSMESTRTGQTSIAGGGSVSGASTPATTSGGDKNQAEEEVNLEYLRNVILQFLENKEMRPNLVRVLSVILRFTPQELRRLNAKISA